MNFSPFPFTASMLKNISDISYLAGEIDSYKGFQNKSQLARKNLMRSIESALSLQRFFSPDDEASGEKTPEFQDISDILNDLPSSLDLPQIQTVKNLYAVYKTVRLIHPYRSKDIEKVNLIIGYKIGSRSNPHRAGIASETSVCGKLDAMLDSLTEKQETVHPLILSSLVYLMTLSMRPFSFGNTYTAGLWQKSMLCSWHEFFQFVPLEPHILNHATDFASALHDFNALGETACFVDLMLETVLEAVREASLDIKASSSEVSRYVKKLMDVMELGVPYTSREILDRLGLKSKETFRAHYIDPALSLGLVIMTEPDKPTSRNQRYIRK